MTLTPLKDMLFVEPILRFPSEVTASGIHLIQREMQGVPIKGTVFAVGKGAEYCMEGGKTIPAKVGDYIMFQSDPPFTFKFEGKKLFRLSKDQVIGIFYEPTPDR